MNSSLSRSLFYDVSDVMAILGVSRSKAYQIIRDLNGDLKKKGFTVSVAGRVSRKFFNERFYCDMDVLESEERREQA